MAGEYQRLGAKRMDAINEPEVMISDVANKFDAQGNLMDEETKNHMRGLPRSRADWTARLRQRAG